PLGNDFPVCKQFNAVCSAAHLIAGEKGNDDIGRGGAPERLGINSARLRSTKIGIIVVEGGYIEREILSCLHSITEVICEEILGVQLMAAEHHPYGRARRMHHRR